MFGFSFNKKKAAPTIFIVEDSATFLLALKSKLKLLYHQNVIVKGFTESETFLEELKIQPDAIIMDFYLGKDSKAEGIELLEKIKITSPKSFVLVLTGEEDLNIAKECFEKGADSYLVKSSESIEKIVQEIHYKIGLKKFL